LKGRLTYQKRGKDDSPIRSA